MFSQDPSGPLEIKPLSCDACEEIKCQRNTQTRKTLKIIKKDMV